MCFVGEPFKYDLFISYSHGVFRGRHDPELKSWSQKFAEDLREELALLDGFDEIAVFLDEAERSDESVDRTEQLTGQLLDKTSKSALFTLLLTPRYLRSKWCRQELDWWFEKHHSDTLGIGSRAYLCRVLPSDEASWPEPIKDVVGYFCYDRDREPESARPFAWRGARDDRYGDVLTHVAGAMARRLRAVKAVLDERRRQEEQARKYAAANGQVLFLHGREQAAGAWEKACERLQEAGFLVVPHKPVPLAANGGLDPEYQAQLATSDGVLLLGTEDGPAIDTDIIVIGRNFRNLAVATKSFLPCAVLNMVGDPLKTDRRVRNARNLRMGWIDSTMNDWPIQVRSWLLEASAEMELVA
jgi:hypothetical protein